MSTRLVPALIFVALGVVGWAVYSATAAFAQEATTTTESTTTTTETPATTVPATPVVITGFSGDGLIVPVGFGVFALTSGVAVVLMMVRGHARV